MGAELLGRLGGDELRLGRGEELTGGRDKASVVADAMEAVIAAVYLDGGFEAVRATIERLFAPKLDSAGTAPPGKDPKTALGKVIQKSYGLNESVDNVGRTAYYLWLRDQGLDEGAAVHQTLRKMGDFSNLSPLEQQIKRVVPFYAWQRHSARMGLDMATRHPWRTSAYMNLTQQGRGDRSDPKNRVDPNDARSGMLRLGKNMFLPVGSIDPFQSTVRSPLPWPRCP